VVLNKKNNQFINLNFDLKFYQERYPELSIQVFEVDLSVPNRNDDLDYCRLRQQIQIQLSQLSHVNDDRPARWNDIRVELRQVAKDKDYINFEHYAEICQKYHVDNRASQLLLSSYLHRLGSLLHFTHDPLLQDFIILKPQWAVDAVYSVLVDNEIANDDGIFTQQKLAQIWKKYSIAEQAHLLNLMKQENFEICYALDQQSQRYLAPQLLNDRQPYYDWDAVNSLKFRFQYKFMPEGIVTRLIVRLNALIAKSKEGDLIWRRGMILEDNHCRAKIIEEENREGLKVIDIAVIGNQHQRKFLLRKVRDEVNAIHQRWFKNIQSEQMIPCNCDCCEQSKEPTYFEFSELKQYQDEGENEIVCRKKHIKRVEVLPLLEGVYLQQPSRRQRDAYHVHSLATNSTYSLAINSNNDSEINPNQTEINTHSVENSNQIDNQDSARPQTVYAWIGDIFIAVLSALVVLGVISHWSTLPLLSASIISLIVGMLSGYVTFRFRNNNLNSIQHSYRKTGTFIVVFVLMNNAPLITGKLDIASTLPNQAALLSLQWGNPLNIFVTVALLIFSGFIFYLSHSPNLLNKNKLRGGSNANLS
jgi:hypothetical protein